MKITALLHWTTLPVAAALLTGCASGLLAADPQLNGPRNSNYDHVIVAGERVGPVRLGGLVTDAVAHLGNPDRVFHMANQVDYVYNSECVQFHWANTGLSPTITSASVSCGKWSAADGLHVGLAITDYHPPTELCTFIFDTGYIRITGKNGILYEAENRNSPIKFIYVINPISRWNGMSGCQD